LGQKLANKEMGNSRLDELVRHLDNHTEGKLGYWQCTIENMGVQVVTGESANRM